MRDSMEMKTRKGAMFGKFDVSDHWDRYALEIWDDQSVSEELSNSDNGRNLEKHNLDHDVVVLDMFTSFYTLLKLPRFPHFP